MPTKSGLKTTHGNEALKRVHPNGVFEWHGNKNHATHILLYIMEHIPRNLYDTLQILLRTFPATICTFLTKESFIRAIGMLGSHAMQIDDIPGIRFAVWAPNAERVSVMGEFNRWDGRIHPMAAHGSSGVWELFIPGIEQVRCTYSKSAIAYRQRADQNRPLRQGF